MTTRYWPTPDCPAPDGVHLELRAKLAWELLKDFGLVAGFKSGEDRTGRAVLDLLPAPEAVNRAFDLADLFVLRAEARGDLRAFGHEDNLAAYRAAGELLRARGQAEYPRSGQSQESLLRELIGGKEKG